MECARAPKKNKKKHTHTHTHGPATSAKAAHTHDAGGGSASSPVVVAPPQYCVVGGTDGLIGGVFIAKTTAVAGIAL